MTTTLPILKTSRLVLRPWIAADVDALHELWIDAAVRRYLWDDIVISRERAADTVTRLRVATELRAAGLVVNGEARRCAVVGSASLTWWPAPKKWTGTQGVLFS